MLKPVLLFILGLVFLIKGGDWFTDSSIVMAKRLRIPELVIGATIVSIGTTLPEVMVSATAAVTGHSQTAYGNAIGSCVCNVALISALTIAIRPTEVNGKTFRFPVCFFFLAAAIYAFTAYAFGFFYRWIGILLLCVFVLYMILTFIRSKKERLQEVSQRIENATDDVFEAEEETMSVAKMIILFVVGAAMIAVGARLLVNNGSIIAEALGVPESVIALTFVALGTSLPELVTAITALVKGHSSLSLGNIIGANLFNLILVSGLATTLKPFGVPVEKQIAGMNASLVIDIPLMFLVMLILVLPVFRKNKLFRAQGIVLLILYAAYTAFQFAF